MIEELKPLIGKLSIFAKKRMGFEHPPRLFLRNDLENSKKMLGKTAFYDPNEKAVTLFTKGRHPKDILRSYAHELVHHTQNLRGDLSPEKCGEMSDGYAQSNGHMREMEREAYEKGNMCFRDWEDTLNDKDTYIIIKIAESKNSKENKSMTTKITKEFLKETIIKILKEQETASMAPLDPSVGSFDISSLQKQAAAASKAQSKATGSRRSRMARKQNQLVQKYFGNLDLMDVQAGLLKLGYYGNVQPEDLERTVDGKYGDNTEKAIIAFQRDVKTNKPIKADGLAGPTFLKALSRVITSPESSTKSRKKLDLADMEYLADEVYPKIPAAFQMRNDDEVPMGQTSMDGGVTAVPSSSSKPTDDLDKDAISKAMDTSARMSDIPADDNDREEKLMAKGGTLRKEQGEELEEAGCGGAKMDDELELEEEKMPDKNKDGIPDYAQDGKGSKDLGKAKGADSDDKEEKNESKIQTPEQENTLYEQRFTPKNNRLYEKLVKQWTK